MKMIPEEITLEFTRRTDEGSVSKVKELMDYVKREVERERTAAKADAGRNEKHILQQK